MSATLGQTVRKSGSMAPNVTTGVVSDLSKDAPITYQQGTAGFVRQIAIEGVNGQPFAQKGDSGSLVVDAATLRPVGLVCATDDQSGITLANPIDAVLNNLGVALA
jgi:hypothetical protein